MVMTANGVVQTREEATVYVKQLDSFVKVVFLEFFLWRTSVRIMGKQNITLDQRSETTSHQKWQKN